MKAGFVIKIEMPDYACRRELVIGQDASLETLADAILWAFDFEMDAGYAFFLDNILQSAAKSYYSRGLNFVHPERFATDVHLGKVLSPNQHFKMLFDFEEKWVFACWVESTALVPEEATASLVGGVLSPPLQHDQKGDNAALRALAKQLDQDAENLGLSRGAMLDRMSDYLAEEGMTRLGQTMPACLLGFQIKQAPENACQLKLPCSLSLADLAELLNCCLVDAGLLRDEKVENYVFRVKGSSPQQQRTYLGPAAPSASRSKHSAQEAELEQILEPGTLFTYVLPDLDLEIQGEYQEETDIAFDDPFETVSATGPVFQGLLDDEGPLPLSDDAYVISVKLGVGCYRHLLIRTEETLEDLADAILDSFHFMNDHAHAFFMDNKIWSKDDAYYADILEDLGDRWTSQYTLGETLDVRQKFKMVFDFGDEWVFQCQVLREESFTGRSEAIAQDSIDEEEKANLLAVIVRSKGQAPEQYPDY